MLTALAVIATLTPIHLLLFGTTLVWWWKVDRKRDRLDRE